MVKCRLCVVCRFETSWLWCKMPKCALDITIMQSQNLCAVTKLYSLIQRKWSLLIKKKSFQITIVLHYISVPIMGISLHHLTTQWSKNCFYFLPMKLFLSICFSVTFKHTTVPYSGHPWLTWKYTKFHAWMCALVLEFFITHPKCPESRTQKYTVATGCEENK